MGRILTISAVLGSLLALPTLCVGGVIAHACSCAAEATCHCSVDCEHECGREHQGGCGHEGGCPDDPCSMRVVRPERHDDGSVTVSRFAITATLIEADVKQSKAETVFPGLLKLPCTRKLPFPRSDLPLLI
ncbi:MAG: hypothetical protein ACE5E5_13705 [Phycisphaerae bacterium]